MFDVILIIHIDTQYEQAKKKKTVERELNDLLLTYVYVKKVDLLKKKGCFLRNYVKACFVTKQRKVFQIYY